MLPPFNQDGLLPEGIHTCDLDEAALRFGRFQRSDRRPRLWARFSEFIREIEASGLIEEVIIDGSFITAKPDPNDIDLLLIVFASHDFGADLPAHHYNVLAEQRVRRRYGFDIVVVKNQSQELALALEFFAQVRQQPALRKGLAKIKV